MPLPHCVYVTKRTPERTPCTTRLTVYNVHDMILSLLKNIMSCTVTTITDMLLYN